EDHFFDSLGLDTSPPFLTDDPSDSAHRYASPAPIRGVQEGYLKSPLGSRRVITDDFHGKCPGVRLERSAGRSPGVRSVRPLEHELTVHGVSREGREGGFFILTGKKDNRRSPPSGARTECRNHVYGPRWHAQIGKLNS